MPQISPDIWLRVSGLIEVLEALHARDGATRIVGGAVRDSLLGLPVADIDLATTLEPPAVVQRLTAAGLKAVPTGIRHGTVTAVARGRGFEVTTLRRDLATDGRHADVQFTNDWQADASRRDFTINALYATPFDGRIRDYFDGLTDLAARRVRFIGDPARRIAEDHLRILRFFRFSARFSPGLDPDGLAAATADAALLRHLAMERIRDELFKTLVTDGAVRVTGAMVERGILRPILPEITDAGVARLARLRRTERETETPPDPVRALAALLSDTGASAIAARLKLSRAERERLEAILGEGAGAPPDVLAYRIGAQAATDRLLLAGGGDAAEGIAFLRGWERPIFPLRGGDLIRMGVPAGPLVSQLLRRIEDAWIGAGFPGKEGAARIAEEEIARHRRAS